MSDHVRSVTMPVEVAEVEATCGGQTAMARLAGLKDWSLTVTFNQDFADNDVDEEIWDAIDAGEVAIIVRPDTEAAAATNPEYTGNGIVFGYDPMNGSIGQLHECSVTIKCSDGVPLARGVGA
ncbi:MAG: hypothetical protein PHC52_13425 [Syntrophales bacterium]|nr:hypothetical protein [Syntrophales bacterium]